MMERGVAHMGIGVGYGENKVVDAAKQAIMSPLLDTTIQGAKGVIFNVTGDRTCGLAEIEEAVKLVQSAADPQANMFIGADIDANLEDEVRITVIATGFGTKATSQAKNIREEVEKKVDALPGSPVIEVPDLNAFDEEEPTLPIFLKKSPRRIKMDDN